MTNTQFGSTRRRLLKGLAATGALVGTIGTRAVAFAQRLGFGRGGYGSGPYGR